jgi:hypothetical protein
LAAHVTATSVEDSVWNINSPFDQRISEETGSFAKAVGLPRRPARLNVCAGDVAQRHPPRMSFKVDFLAVYRSMKIGPPDGEIFTQKQLINGNEIPNPDRTLGIVVHQVG